MEKRIEDHPWHVAINYFNFPVTELGETIVNKKIESWMYESKRMYQETRRLKILFEMERTGKLPSTHKQCSRSPEVPIKENFLICCLRKKTAECPYLKALEKAKVSPEQIDEIKAYTFCTHIVRESGKQNIDTSEGYLTHEGDRMYWENVIKSLSEGEDQDLHE